MNRKTYKDYMDDPRIINELMPLREVFAIRLKLEDERKHMTSQERTADINKKTDPIIKQFGIRIAEIKKNIKLQ